MGSDSSLRTFLIAACAGLPADFRARPGLPLSRCSRPRSGGPRPVRPATRARIARTSGKPGSGSKIGGRRIQHSCPSECLAQRARVVHVSQRDLTSLVRPGLALLLISHNRAHALSGSQQRARDDSAHLSRDSSDGKHDSSLRPLTDLRHPPRWRVLCEPQTFLTMNMNGISFMDEMASRCDSTSGC